MNCKQELFPKKMRNNLEDEPLENEPNELMDNQHRQMMDQPMPLNINQENLFFNRPIDPLEEFKQIVSTSNAKGNKHKSIPRPKNPIIHDPHFMLFNYKTNHTSNSCESLQESYQNYFF